MYELGILQALPCLLCTARVIAVRQKMGKLRLHRKHFEHNLIFFRFKNKVESLVKIHTCHLFYHSKRTLIQLFKEKMIAT